MRSRTGWMMIAAVATLVGGCPHGVVTPAVTTGLTRRSHLALFLTRSDLPRMRRVQDTRMKGPSPSDRQFARQQGVSTGFAVWMGRRNARLWRVVDVRWVFPSPKLARRYLRRSLRRNSERMRPVDDAPEVGADSRLFGGRQRSRLGLALTHYIYLFRVGNVVVKLYGAQGMRGRGLNPTVMARLGRRVVRRILASAR